MTIPGLRDIGVVSACWHPGGRCGPGQTVLPLPSCCGRAGVSVHCWLEVRVLGRRRLSEGLSSALSWVGCSARLPRCGVPMCLFSTVMTPYPKLTGHILIGFYSQKDAFEFTVLMAADSAGPDLCTQFSPDPWPVPPGEGHARKDCLPLAWSSGAVSWVCLCSAQEALAVQPGQEAPSMSRR